VKPSITEEEIERKVAENRGGSQRKAKIEKPKFVECVFIIFPAVFFLILCGSLRKIKPSV
jgi:hypothetical protein